MGCLEPSTRFTVILPLIYSSHAKPLTCDCLNSKDYYLINVEAYKYVAAEVLEVFDSKNHANSLDYGQNQRNPFWRESVLSSGQMQTPKRSIS